jgi:RND superfamily putative drug exporter
MLAVASRPVAQLRSAVSPVAALPALLTVVGCWQRWPPSCIVSRGDSRAWSGRSVTGSAAARAVGALPCPGGRCAPPAGGLRQRPTRRYCGGAPSRAARRDASPACHSWVSWCQGVLVGDIATGLSLVDQARANLVRVAIAVGLVNLLPLVLFLRALVAPCTCSPARCSLLARQWG